MKRLLAFGLLLGVASVFAMAGPSKTVYDTTAIPTNPATPKTYTGSYWTPVNKEGHPYATMHGDNRSAYFAVAKSPSSKACEFAIIAERNEVRFQIIDEQGEFHSLPVTALLKLADKPKSSDTPATPAAAKDDIPRGYKVLYAIARTRAAGELAKKENISRAAAREKIDSISDAELHAQVKAAGIAVAKEYPGEGKLKAIIDWLIEHQDAIRAIVTLLLSIFA